jgi:prophage tail gpP-like protein
MTLDVNSAFFECVVAEGARILTSAKPNNMGGEVTKWSIDSDFLVSTDGFEFEFIGETPDARGGLNLAPVELKVDGQTLLHGRIDITIQGDKGPSIVTVRGRDYLADLVEGDIDPNVTIAAGATLEDAILQACGPYGITGVEGPEARQLARTKKQQKPAKKPRKKQLKDDRPQAGQCVYDWSNRILARHSLTMQPASTPEKVVLQAPNYEQDSIGRIIRKVSKSGEIPSNVVKGVATRDFSKCPTYALFSGRQGDPTEKSTRTVAGVNSAAANWVEKFEGSAQASNAGGNNSVSAHQETSVRKLKNTWDMGAVAFGYSAELYSAFYNHSITGRRLPKDRSVILGRELYRLLYWRDELAKTQEQIDASALRAVAERLKDTLQYEVTLRGLVNPDTGYYWATDTIVDVDDDVADVHEKMWVAGRRFAFDGQNLTTVLRCWRPGSFQIGDPSA